MKSLNKQFSEISSGGWPVIQSKILSLLKYLILLICGLWAIPLVIIIRCLRPWYVIRFGPISTSRIGTFVNEVAGICQRQSKGCLDLYWFDLPISNDFFAAMVQRTFHVSPFVCPLDLWNQILPGGAMHHLPPVGMLQLSSDIQDWQKMIQEVLPFSPEEDAWAKAWLCQQGWHEGEPFVCLLVRDSSYMDNTYPNTTPPEETGAKYHPKYGYGWNHLNYRDSDISTYVPAAEWLAGQGVWVLRMGKVMARPIPSNHSRLIDYAFHPEKSDFLDIWLFAHCDLCVSTGTGIDTISDIYCRPILYLNYLPLWMTTSFSNTTHLPKTLLWQASGIPLNCKEYFALNTHSEYYDRIGIRIIDLTPEEILSAVQEQWQRLQGTWVDTEEDLQRYQRFWEILDSLPQFPGWHGWIQFKARVGATWLRSKGDDFLN